MLVKVEYRDNWKGKPILINKMNSIRIFFFRDEKSKNPINKFANYVIIKQQCTIFLFILSIHFIYIRVDYSLSGIHLSGYPNIGDRNKSSNIR